MCLVSASLRLKLFSSVQYWHWTLCLVLLCIVSSCRVKSYGRLNMVLQGFPVVGLMREHLCGPVWLFRARSADDDRFVPRSSSSTPSISDASGVADVPADERETEGVRCCVPALGAGCASRRWRWSLADVSNRRVQFAAVHVYVPVLADVVAGA